MAGDADDEYGDEIGIGDDLRLPERECGRTPMQWTADRHGGFSRAGKVVRSVIDDKVYGYKRVNVAGQRRDSQSLLNWTERVIRARKECPEISWGNFEILRTNVPEVLAMRYDWRDTSLITRHNFGSAKRTIRLKADCPHGDLLVEAFDGRHSKAQNDGAHRIPLTGYTHGDGSASAVPTTRWADPIWISPTRAADRPREADIAAPTCRPCSTIRSDVEPPAAGARASDSG